MISIRRRVEISVGPMCGTTLRVESDNPYAGNKMGKLCGAVRSRDQTAKALPGGIYLVAVIELYGGTIKDGDQYDYYSLIS